VPLTAQAVEFNNQQAALEQAIAQLKTDCTQALLALAPKAQKIQTAVFNQPADTLGWADRPCDQPRRTHGQ